MGGVTFFYMHFHISFKTDLSASNLYVCLPVSYWMARVFFIRQVCSFQFLCGKPSMTPICSKIEPTLLSRWLPVIHNLTPINFYSCILYCSPLPSPQPTHQCYSYIQIILISRTLMTSAQSSISSGNKNLPSCSFIKMLLFNPQGIVKCPVFSSISGQIWHFLIRGL